MMTCNTGQLDKNHTQRSTEIESVGKVTIVARVFYVSSRRTAAIRVAGWTGLAELSLSILRLRSRMTGIYRSTASLRSSQGPVRSSRSNHFTPFQSFPGFNNMTDFDVSGIRKTSKWTLMTGANAKIKHETDQNDRLKNGVPN